MIPDNLKAAFNDAKAHARAQFPKESCGVIAGGKYHALENVAKDPSEHQKDNESCDCQLCSFRIDPSVYASFAAGLSGEFQFVVHSHPNGPFYPSRADMESQKQTAVPWAIIALDAERAGDPVIWGDSLPIEPVIGRQFMHGVHDCYSLIRDCYRLGKHELVKQDILDWPFEPTTLMDMPREDAWWDGDADLYMENFLKAGFMEIDAQDATPGDVFLAKIRSDKYNHGGLLIGNDLILHHLPSRLSRREPAGLWGRQAGVWLRYIGKADA